MQEKSEQSYWATVKDCLRELHSFTPTKANNQIREYRKQIEALSIESAIYHDEPYEVACDIAGVSSENRADWERYQIIRKAHFPSPSNVVPLVSRMNAATSTKKKKPAPASTRGRQELQSTGTEGRTGTRYSAAGSKTRGARSTAKKKTLPTRQTAKKTAPKSTSSRKGSPGKKSRGTSRSAR
jgi:hypothetical protein